MKHTNRAFFGRGIQPRCAYCAHAAAEAPGCTLGLSFPEEGACRRFRYDPLRRAPLVRPPLPKFDPDDFKL